MKTLQINNKNYQECDVVMLHTTTKSRIKRYEGFLKDRHLVLDRTPHKGRGNGVFRSQHLYILTNDEIKEGDWYKYPNQNGVWCNNEGTVPNRDARKIIATTDSSLKTKVEQSGENAWYNLIPQIPQQFIEYFISEYNKGKIIDKVLVETEEKNEYISPLKVIPPATPGVYTTGYKLKLNQNNEISILTEEKQETIEEAALKYVRNESDATLKLISKYSFKDGAKWQAERMYNEQDLREAFNIAKHIGRNNIAYEFDEWFNRHKKK